MKKNILMAMVIMLFAGFSYAKEEKNQEDYKSKKFTLEDLKKYDGKDGRPSYVAVDGVVYDVSGSKYWKKGAHMNMHQAGGDLTKDIKQKAPQKIHKGGKILEKMPKVGVLAEEEKKETKSVKVKESEKDSVKKKENIEKTKNKDKK